MLDLSQFIKLFTTTKKTDQMNEWIKIFVITQFSIESEIKWNYYYY